MLNININELALINLRKDIEIDVLKGQVQQAFQQIQELQKKLEKYEPKPQSKKKD